MDSLDERLKKYFLKKMKAHPWAYGRKGHLSKKAQGVWSLLSKKEKLLISRYSPSKKHRDQLIRTLSNSGITRTVLSEMSGYSIRAIYYILNSKADKEK